MKIDDGFPISKYSIETGWIFIKQFNGTYKEALKEALKLQEEDIEYLYRIWDNR